MTNEVKTTIAALTLNELVTALRGHDDFEDLIKNAAEEVADEKLGGLADSEEFERAVTNAIEEYDRDEHYVTERDLERAVEDFVDGDAVETEIEEALEPLAEERDALKAMMAALLDAQPKTLAERLRWMLTGRARS